MSLQVVGFYSPEWHVMLRGSRPGLLELARKIDSSLATTDVELWIPGRVPLGNYASFLHSVAIRSDPGDQRVRLQVSGRTVQVAGAPRHLTALATQIREVADQAEGFQGPRQGFHAHFEPFPSGIPHPFLDTESFPLIVAYYTPDESSQVFVARH